MRLIEREAAESTIAKLMPNLTTPDGSGHLDEIIFYAQQMCADAIETIRELPTIDAAPVVHEKWVWREEWDNHPETHSCDLISCGWYCTGCGIELGDYLTKATGKTVVLDDDSCKPKLLYCPSCGARMRGEGHEAD